jgi:hypothetical protein
VPIYIHIYAVKSARLVSRVGAREREGGTRKATAYIRDATSGVPPPAGRPAGRPRTPCRRRPQVAHHISMRREGRPGGGGGRARVKRRAATSAGIPGAQRRGGGGTREPRVSTRLAVRSVRRGGAGPPAPWCSVKWRRTTRPVGGVPATPGGYHSHHTTQADTWGRGGWGRGCQ